MTAAPGTVQEQILALSAFQKLRPTPLEVLLDTSARRLVKWNKTLFVSLAHRPKVPERQVQIAGSKPEEFRNPQTSRIEQFDYCLVAQVKRAVVLTHHDIQQPSCLFKRKSARKMRRSAWSAYQAGWIAGNIPLPCQVPVKPSQRGLFAGNRGLSKTLRAKVFHVGDDDVLVDFCRESNSLFVQIG